jgi:ABC-type glycerol-3-phosphate transport system substrate-binding protein
MLEASEEAENADNGLRGTFIAAGQRSCVVNILMGFVKSNGGNLCTRDENDEVQVALTESGNKERWLETINFVNNLHEFSPPASDAGCGGMIQAITGKVSASAMYSGARTKNNTVNQELDFAEELTCAFQPQGPNGEEKITWGRPEGSVTFEGANTTAAKEYIKMFAESEVHMPYYRRTPIHLTPQFPGLLESDAYQEMLDNLPSEWKEVDKQIPLTPHWEGFVNEVQPPNPYVGPLVESQLIEAMFGRVVYRDDDPETVLEETQSEMESILQEAKG